MSSPNRFLLCFQTPYDTVRYITSDMSTPSHLSYYKFLDFIAEIFISNFNEFRDHLDKFHTMLIDLDTHTWELYEAEKRQVEFKELFDYNEKIEKEKEENKSKYENINQKKRFIAKINKKDSLHKGNPMLYNKDFYRIRGS